MSSWYELLSAWCSKSGVLWIIAFDLSWRLRRHDGSLSRYGILHHSHSWGLGHLLPVDYFLLGFETRAQSILVRTVSHSRNRRLLQLLRGSRLHILGWSWGHYLRWYFVDLDGLNQSLLEASSGCDRWRLLSAYSRVSEVGVGWVNSWGGTSHHVMVCQELHVICWSREVAQSSLCSCSLHSLVSTTSHCKHVVLGSIIHQVCLWRLDGANHYTVLIQRLLFVLWIHCTLQFLKLQLFKRHVLGSLIANPLIVHLFAALRTLNVN